MFCGAGSFPREDGVDPWSPPPPPSPPRMPSRRQGRSSNPYSTRGLDEFSTVLADLQARKEMITGTAKANERGSPIVRFVYSDGCWVSVVARPRPEPEKKPKNDKKGASSATTESRKEPDAAAAKEVQSPPRVDLYAKRAAHADGKEGSTHVFFRWDPCYYWPAVVVLILLCLAFGRAFAICCTSVCWFSLPRTKVGDNRNVRKGVRKEYRRRASKRHELAGAGRR